jgi:hypothetical protein
MKPAKTRVTTSRVPAEPTARGVTLGRATWRKICAVEGIVPNKETERMFEEFDRLGLSAEERRRRIIAKHQGSTKK